MLLCPSITDSIVQNLGVHALTGCDTTSLFSGFDKKHAGTWSLSFPHRLTGLGKDDNFDDVEKFVCLLYGIGENVVKDINDASCSLFVKAKRYIEMVPPTNDTLELHITRANYRAKIWLHADHAIMDLENKPFEFIGWQECTHGQEVVLKRLPVIPDACVQLLSMQNAMCVSEMQMI